MNKFTASVIAALALVVSPAARSDDPGKDIKFHKLSNGTRVYLAPTYAATTFQIKLRVQAGTLNEAPGKSGVAHLLEHFLFKDAKLEKSMTYLEAIKENGGSGNAITEPYRTTYFATFPPAKIDWAIETFSKILLDKTFDDQSVAETKGPVFLEIGRPGPNDYLYYFAKKVWPEIATVPDFWESEFGVKLNYRIGEDKFQTSSINAQDVRDYYEKYYHSGNLTIFVTGQFDAEAVLKKLETIYGKLPAKEFNGFTAPEPVVAWSPYYRSKVTSSTPRIEIGTKLAGLTFDEEVAVEIYMDHLAHRLMKEIRNVKGETYTAYPSTYYYKGYGTASIQMESSPEGYKLNSETLTNLIETEARQGNIDEKLYSDAMKLFGSKFDLCDFSSSTLMSMAEWKDDSLERFPGEDNGSYKSHKNMTREKYVAALKKAFDPKMKMASLTEPPVFFRYEYALLMFGAIGGWMYLSRRWLTNRFDHMKLRWVRKLRYPPAYLLQIGVFVSSFGVVTMLTLIFDRAIQRWTSIPSSSFVINEYLFDALEFGFLVLGLQFALGLYPRKLMVVGEDLFIKSLAVRSQVIPLSEIEAVENVHCMRMLISPRRLWSVKLRFYYYDLIMRTGCYIRLKNGKAYYFGVTSEAIAELQQLVHGRKHEETMEAVAPAA